MSDRLAVLLVVLAFVAIVAMVGYVLRRTKP
jgi:hypothetical protein